MRSLHGGLGVPADEARAFRLFEEAAAAGEPGALYQTALFARDGIGRPRNLEQAETRLREAGKDEAEHHESHHDFEQGKALLAC